LPRLRQPLVGILANGFEKAISPAVRDGHHQRLVDQVGQQLENLGLVNFTPRTHCLRRLERPAAVKDGKSAKKNSLLVGEQIVAPVDQRAQGLLPRQRGPVAARKETETIAQARRDVLYRQGTNARCSEFDRQRNAVKTLT